MGGADSDDDEIFFDCESPPMAQYSSIEHVMEEAAVGRAPDAPSAARWRRRALAAGAALFATLAILGLARTAGLWDSTCPCSNCCHHSPYINWSTVKARFSRSRAARADAGTSPDGDASAPASASDSGNEHERVGDDFNEPTADAAAALVSERAAPPGGDSGQREDTAATQTVSLPTDGSTDGDDPAASADATSSLPVDGSTQDDGAVGDDLPADGSTMGDDPETAVSQIIVQGKNPRAATRG